MSETAPIEFALFAPYNEVVEFVAEIDQWKPQSMQKGKDGWWRLTVPLPDGDHKYRFRVKSLSWFCKDKMMDVFDPYSFQDTHEEPENSIIKIRGGKRSWIEYEWKHDAVPLPQNHELVIYELFVGDFAGKPDQSGTFQDVIAKLDYIKDIGINAIELMPVKGFDGKGWGYLLKSLFSVEAKYGTPNDLAQLVDECHGRAMRVIIDGVYNHSHTEAPFTKIDYEYWYYRENPDPKELHWGPKFNYHKFDENLKLCPAAKYVEESIAFWVEKFHIDGVRFDATLAIKDFGVMKKFTDVAFKQVDGRKPFVTIAEHVPEDPKITGYPKGPMVAAWHWVLGARLRAILAGKEIEGQSPDDIDAFLKDMDPKQNGYESGQRYVNYISSHDQDRIMHQVGEQGHMFGEAAFRRVKLGLGIIATLPGLPMIWMGQEFGFASDKSLDPRPLDWSLLDNPLNKGLHDHYRALLKLRLETDALRNDNFEVVFLDKAKKCFAYKRWNVAGQVVIVAVNCTDDDAGGFAVEKRGLEDGCWHEFVHNLDLDVKDGKLVDTLGPSEVKIYLKC